MKKISIVLLIVMVLTAATASAQYSQDRPNVEFMIKVEAGYLHNVGNYGQPEKESRSTSDTPAGYRLRNNEECTGLNFMAGVNISQDFFLGAGLGYGYCFPYYKGNVGYTSSNLVQLFVDMDFRPVGDIWAPMAGARVGGSMLMNPGNYGTTMSPYLEVYGGLNWFYDHALQQMSRNYHSLFVEVGLVATQQSLLIPIRVGWRL